MYPSAPPSPRPRLLPLACCSLLLTATFELGCGFAGQWEAFAPISAGQILMEMAAGILLVFAILTAVAPAVLAQGHRGFRCSLVVLHVLIGWTIQVGTFANEAFASPQFLAEVASVSLLMVIGLSAGLSGGLLLLAAIFGWRLTVDRTEAARVTFSVRGILIATAVAALLLTLPRFAPPLIAFAVRLICHYGVLPEYWSGSFVTIDTPGDELGAITIPALVGLLLAIPVASAMWCRYSRKGLPGVILGAVALTLLTVLPNMTAGNPIGTPLMTLVIFAVSIAGPLLATLQTQLWHAFGARLVRVGRTPPAAQAATPTVNPVS